MQQLLQYLMREQPEIFADEEAKEEDEDEEDDEA